MGWTLTVSRVLWKLVLAGGLPTGWQSPDSGKGRGRPNAAWSFQHRQVREFSVLIAFPYYLHHSQQATTQVFVLEEILGAAWTGGRSLRFKTALCLSPWGSWARHGLFKPPSLPLKDGAIWPPGEGLSLMMECLGIWESRASAIPER